MAKSVAEGGAMGGARETGSPLGGTEGSNPFLHRRVRPMNGVDAWRMIGRRVLDA
jgi:hypothetical protein